MIVKTGKEKEKDISEQMIAGSVFKEPRNTNT